jgi:predicted Zn-dependent protease
MKLLVALAVALLLAPACVVQAQTVQDTPTLEISSIRWNKSTIQILIIEAPSETWWKAEFTNATLNAIDNWKSGFNFFSAKYPDYAYLNNLTFNVTVSQQTIDGYDVYIRFAATISQQNQLVLGETTTYPTVSNNIDHCTVTLATTSQTLSFNTDGMMSVAAHEFGHVLCLGHSNSNSDLMYPSNDLIFSQNELSTLDLYGVAVVFNWLDPGSPLAPQTGTISLPASIPLEYAPATHRSSTPQGQAIDFVAAAAAFIEQNIVMLLIILAAIFFLFALTIVLRGKRSNATK